MSLSPRTRMYLGLGGMAFATVGMLLSDKIEEQRPATEIEMKELERLSPVIVVDRQSKV
ncbi:hypothetical protein BDF20DRAFT_910987 [Mycotypha africana]|uniref:uncharacterized protein n=1 Tax=Mycotypha africana TaxID=64632 RepID=UPI0022FFFF5C|nr:uncharacterized protein BDF20DRAFT_910987 [Mycotypha africana]KAI8988524.1 hypothetical protein BDF20DRAFT_910987 [Mycotypha africana]